MIITVIGLCFWSQSVIAAPPSIHFTEGVVAASNNATYSPNIVGPASFTTSGACPRWSGTIHTTNLATAPITSVVQASELDAGDIVTFALTLQNTSIDGAAYDIFVRHNIPAGFELPNSGAENANVCVHTGNGSSVPFTTNGNGFFGNTSNDGIELTDPTEGVLAATHPTNGNDIIVITFDLRVAEDYTPGSTKQFVAELLNYSDQENGDPTGNDEASTLVTTRGFAHAKTLTATNQVFTPNNFVAVGEQLTYELTVTVPEGVTNNSFIIDTMTPGLAFISCESITNNAPSYLSSNVSGNFAGACNDPINPVITNNGRLTTFNLGDIANTNRSNGSNETITIIYKAVVVNEAAASNGTTLNNSAIVRWGDGTNNSASASAPVTVHEPILTLQGMGNPAGGVVQPGAIIHFTYAINHHNDSEVDAFDARFTEVLPNGLQFVAGSLACSGTAATSCLQNNGTVEAAWSTFANNASATVTFDAIVQSSSADVLLHTLGTASWSGLPGIITSPQSTYAPLSTERTASSADPGGVQNNYSAVAALNFAVAGNGPGDPSSQNNNGISPQSSTNILADTGSSLLVVTITAGVLLFSGAIFLWKWRKLQKA